MYGAFTAKWPVCTMTDIKFPSAHFFTQSESSQTVARSALVGILFK